MKIAVNARFLSLPYREGFGHFIYEIFSRLIITQGEHEFIFIYDRPLTEPVFAGKNVKEVVAGPQARHPILWKWWYDITIPRIIKKHKADVFVSCDGFCSLQTQLPQCLVIHDLAYLHFPTPIPKAHLLYMKRFVPKFIQKARVLATVSDFSRNEISAASGISRDKIEIIPNGVRKVFKPLTSEERMIVKNKYTSGKEYFLYTGAIHPRKNLVNLLKAFSLFKKRQQTGMKLVIAGRVWKNDPFPARLKTYRYRDDVVVTGYLPDEELASLTASAYAMVYPSLYEGFGVPVAEAMKSGVPVITSLETAMVETAGDAALLADPASPNQIAEMMMLLYKDENLRNTLIRKGFEHCNQFNWEESATKMWACINKAIG